MVVARTIPETRAAIQEARAKGRSVGFVPTMGALHAGHVSLLDAARSRGDTLIASIFVNPTQFGPTDDFTEYPRDEARDLETCRKAGAFLAFVPSVAEMYPGGLAGTGTTVHVTGLSDKLCGPFRPGHFDGVATVVAKLLHIVQPDRAYFGQKDAQQLVIIRRMARDLDIPTEIVGCPTVREPDGLAMSSRNAYLSASERQQATALFRSLKAAQAEIQGGRRDARELRKLVEEIILSSGPARIDYVSFVDPESLEDMPAIDNEVLIALAVRIGSARLIDNLTVKPPPA